MGGALRRRALADQAQALTGPRSAQGLSQAAPFLMWLINPLVEASWLFTRPGTVNSGRIFLASCLPNSTPHWSKELMFQMMPCTKILCSYSAINRPSDRGVISSTTIELVG